MERLKFVCISGLVILAVVSLYTVFQLQQELEYYRSTAREQETIIAELTQERDHYKEQSEENNAKLLHAEDKITELEELLDLRVEFVRLVETGKGAEIDLTQPTGYTPTQERDMLEEAFHRYNSPMQGLGGEFVAAAQGYNPIALAGISILETGWGRSGLARKKHNYFGWSAYDSNPSRYASRFGSPQHSIRRVGASIGRLYIDPGGRYYNGATLRGMNQRYASDPRWAEKIGKIMRMIVREDVERLEGYQSYRRLEL